VLPGEAEEMTCVYEGVLCEECDFYPVCDLVHKWCPRYKKHVEECRDVVLKDRSHGGAAFLAHQMGEHWTTIAKKKLEALGHKVNIVKVMCY